MNADPKFAKSLLNPHCIVLCALACGRVTFELPTGADVSDCNLARGWLGHDLSGTVSGDDRSLVGMLTRGCDFFFG